MAAGRQDRCPWHQENCEPSESYPATLRSSGSNAERRSIEVHLEYRIKTSIPSAFDPAKISSYPSPKMLFLHSVLCFRLPGLTPARLLENSEPSSARARSWCRSGSAEASQRERTFRASPELSIPASEQREFLNANGVGSV